MKIEGLGLSDNDRKLMAQRDQMRAEVMRGLCVPLHTLQPAEVGTRANLTLVYPGARRADELVREE